MDTNEDWKAAAGDGSAPRNEEKKENRSQGSGDREDGRPYRPRIQHSNNGERYSSNTSGGYQGRSQYGRSDRPYQSSSDRSQYGGERRSYGQSRPYNRFNNAEGGEQAPSENGESRPSYGDRSSYGDRPYRPRVAGGYERRSDNTNDRPSGDRPAGDRPYRPRYNNEGGDSRSSQGGEDKPWRQNSAYRSQGGGSSYGDRSSRPYRPSYNNAEGGERRSYGDRPNYGDRDRSNSYGDRNRTSYGSSDRPSYGDRSSSYGDRPSRPYRPRYNEGGEGERSYGNSRYNGGDRGGYRRNSDGQRPYNSNYSLKKQITYKEENLDPNAPIRLNKYLSNAGVCSRREADEFITAGVVSVNGAVVTELGTKVTRTDEVRFHEEPVQLERKVYVLLNKPKDCVTTVDDPQERKTVMQLVNNACRERIYPVGRLDRNTTGVLLLTNDGELASKLTHPKFLKKKVYQVTCDRVVSKEDLDKIASGIELEDGMVQADAVGFSNEDDRKEVGIEIHSGKNRIVRRIFE
ncbi:MAG: pseudouridine synthase, partial [Bacteroidaceae bacterium]